MQTERLEVPAVGGWVELLDTLPGGPPPAMDLAVVRNARVSYGRDVTDVARDRKLLAYLWSHGHGTPFEAAVFRFRLCVPVVVWWHLVRHRIASFNLQSGRYTEYRERAYHPRAWRMQDDRNRQGSAGEIEGAAATLLAGLWAEHLATSFERYHEALALGVAREQARLFLPAFALMETGIITINARSLINLLAQRCAPEAQAETRAVAGALRVLFVTAMPWTAAAVGVAEERED